MPKVVLVASAAWPASAADAPPLKQNAVVQPTPEKAANPNGMF